MKTKQTKEQMKNNLLYSVNFRIRMAKSCYEKYGEDNINTLTDDAKAASAVGILCDLGFITEDERREITEQIYYHDYDNIPVFDVDFACFM